MPPGLKTDIPQLLKWVGNKHRFAEEIVSYMPQDIRTYYEPFLGSGAVLGTLCNYNKHSLFRKFERAVGSDVLPFLIEIFQYVKENPGKIIDYYSRCIEGYDKDRENKYLEIRDRFNASFSGLDFAVLSRTCYSGIIRFRKKDGYMSTPIGPHNPIPPDAFKERVMVWHELLQDNVHFTHDDFRNVMDMAKEGDVVYCDPPYTHSQAILYGAQEFKIEDLWDKIYDCKQRGAKVLLSINGKKKSGSEDVGVYPPEGLFARETFVNCGISMVNRLQKAGDVMENENVDDSLMLTW